MAEEFFMYGEDVLLSWQILRKNKKAIGVENATVEHEGTGSSVHGDIFYEYQVARGHILLARKTATNMMQLILFLAGRALFLSARGVVRAARFRKIAPLLAFFYAWTGKDFSPLS